MNRLDPTSGMSQGVEPDLPIGDNFYLGFNFSNQESNLQGIIQGEGRQNFTDMSLQSYCGIFGYNLEQRCEVLPFGPRRACFGAKGTPTYINSDAPGIWCSPCVKGLLGARKPRLLEPVRKVGRSGAPIPAGGTQ